MRDLRAVVVGGGAVAERKVRALRDAGARVTVVSPTLTPTLSAFASSGEIAWEARAFSPGDTVGARLAFAATPDVAVNGAVVADARANGALVNDASEPERGDFHTPAVHRSGPLTIAVDSTGLSPSFTVRVRDELAVQLDARYARAAATLGALRARVLAVVPAERRSAVMRHFAERDIDDLASMPTGAIEHEVERALDTVAGVVPGTPTTLVCASRASALAMWQTRSIMAKLAESGLASTVLNITTKGDAIQDRSLAAIGTDSLFVKELELALREKRADYAVHSCKDLPSTLPSDMTIAAITKREDPRDAYCSERYATFAELPAGARVGTSSPRRRAQLSALRPDLRFDDIRGNVDTRLRKLRDGEYDAIVLAMAGLNRLGLSAPYVVPFPVEVVIPAVAQGALAIETRLDDRLATQIGGLLGDPATHLAVLAERAFLRTLRGGCQAPVGAHATYANGTLRFIATIVARDGSSALREMRETAVDSVATAEALATEVALDLLARGGDALLGDEPKRGELSGNLFLLPRTQERPSRIAAALRDAGAEVVEAADSVLARTALAGRTPSALLFPSSGSVRAITDYLRALREDGAKPVVAAMGPASAEAATSSGWAPDVVAPEADIASFVQAVTRHVLENAP